MGAGRHRQSKGMANEINYHKTVNYAQPSRQVLLKHEIGGAVVGVIGTVIAGLITYYFTSPCEVLVNLPNQQDQGLAEEIAPREGQQPPPIITIGKEPVPHDP